MYTQLKETPKKMSRCCVKQGNPCNQKQLRPKIQLKDNATHRTNLKKNSNNNPH